MRQRQESKVMKDENKKETTEGIEKNLLKYYKEALALKEEFLKNNPTDCSGDDVIECAKNRARSLKIQRKARAIFYGYKAQERYDLLFKYLKQKSGLVYGRHDLDAFKKAGAKENKLEKFYIEQEKKVWKKRLQEAFVLR
jgi:deoxyadenosine/deoxycytidine kinase